jgi:hypothetical protein
MSLLDGLKKRFSRFNPDVDASSIDFTAYMDRTLNLTENLEILSEAYPCFRWDDTIKRIPSMTGYQALLQRDVFRTTYGMRIFKPSPSKIRPQSPVEGFDTETDKGYARVASDSTRWIEIHDIDDVFNFLLDAGRSEHINLFFNLKFDFECLFKWKHSLLRELLKGDDEGRKIAHYDDYEIKYVKGKCFTIHDWKKKLFYNYYDVSQFFNSSLEYAVAKYLGKKCHDLKGERHRLFELHPMGSIGEYCQDDATKTKELGEFILGKFAKMHLFPNKLYSCGYVAQCFTLNNANIPHFNEIPRVVQEYYWRSYRGGWFDTFQRGMFRCDSFDLKSAYPWALSQIPDPCGTWKRGYDPDAIAGVYLCELSGKRDGCPIAIRTKLKSIYPLFDRPAKVYLTLGEISALEDFYDILILDGYYLDKTSDVRPYEPLVRRLFALKEASKDDIGLYDTIKKVINSLYGKTAQVTMTDGIPHAGRLFNPYFASECTSRCRIRIHEAIKDQLDKVVSVMTDGVLIEPGSSLKEDKKLGGFEKKFSCTDTVIVETGVYEPLGQGIKTRGFTRKKILFDDKGHPYTNKDDVISLFDLLNTRDSKIKVYQFRPRHFSECLIQRGLGAERIGVFEAVERELDLNAGLKRLWFEKVRGVDLLEKQFQSHPVPSSLFM